MTSRFRWSNTTRGTPACARRTRTWPRSSRSSTSSTSYEKRCRRRLSCSRKAFSSFHAMHALTLGMDDAMTAHHVRRYTMRVLYVIVIHSKILKPPSPKGVNSYSDPHPQLHNYPIKALLLRGLIQILNHATMSGVCVYECCACSRVRLSVWMCLSPPP